MQRRQRGGDVCSGSHVAASVLYSQYYTEETIYEEVPGEVRLGHTCVNRILIKAKRNFSQTSRVHEDSKKHYLWEDHSLSSAQTLVMRKQILPVGRWPRCSCHLIYLRWQGTVSLVAHRSFLVETVLTRVVLVAVLGL